MKKGDVEQACLDHLLAGRIDAACAIAAEQRGEGAATAPSRIDCILATSPKILHEVPATSLQVLRIGAAMMELWGTNRCAQWMPRRFALGIAMDTNAAARMVLFASAYRDLVTRYPPDIVDQVEWLAAPDCCPECAAMNGRRFPPAQAPELPHDRCTHHMGCRCTWAPIVDWDLVGRT